LRKKRTSKKGALTGGVQRGVPIASKVMVIRKIRERKKTAGKAEAIIMDRLMQTRKKTKELQK